MYRTRISLIALMVLIVLTSLLAGCGRRGILNINGEKVPKDEFYARLEQVSVQTQGGSEMAGTYVMRQIINERLVMQLAKERNVAPTEAQIEKKIEMIRKESGGNLNNVLAQGAMTMDDLKRKITVEQSFVNLASRGIAVPDEDVKKAYESALKAKNSPFVKQESVVLSAIACSTKAKVDKAYQLLTDGTDFGAVATRLSEGPSQQKQGQLGVITRSMELVPKIVRDTAFSLRTGSYSKPMLVGKEWMILKSDKRRPASQQKFEDVKQMIKEQMAVREGLKTTKYPTELGAFMQKAEIKVNAERYKMLPDLIKKEAAQRLQQMNGAAAGGTVPAASRK